MTSPRETVPKLAEVGKEAPEFSLNTHPSGTISLSDFKGKKNVILAFYPKDDTPGCTKEMCAFSEDLAKFQDAQTEVLGISCDTTESHAQFADKFSLKQTLLADPDGQTGRAYGTVSADRSYANRVLFVIDKNGTVRHVVEGMPDNSKLLEILNSLD